MGEGEGRGGLHGVGQCVTVDVGPYVCLLAG